MSDAVKHSMIWATCVASIAACFMLSSIFGQPSPRRTALQDCSWDFTKASSAFCMELAKTAAREDRNDK